MSKQPYVIRVGPNFPRAFLGQKSDETDGMPSNGPVRTSNVYEALQFADFVEARRVLRRTTKQYPTYEFRLDVLEPKS